jgi:hypothetical protein
MVMYNEIGTITWNIIIKVQNLRKASHAGLTLELVNGKYTILRLILSFIQKPLTKNNKN